MQRVLCGDDKERNRQRVCFTVQRDLVFFHGFEQCALCLRRAAVDFIGQHDVGENRAGMKSNACRVLLKTEMPTMSAGSMSLVNWMRRKDRPSTAASARASSGLADARHVFDQQVTTGQQAGEGEFDLGLLAEDDLTDLAVDLLGQLLRLLQLIRIRQCCDIPRHGQVPLGSDFSGR